MLPVVILAGGLAKRMWPETVTIPKALLPVAGRPFVDHQLGLLRRHGVTRVVLLLGHLAEPVMDHLGDGSAFGLSVEYALDGPQLLGTGGALKAALSKLGQEFFVLYGDSYLECDYVAIEAAFRASGRQALMTVFRNEGQWDTSNVEWDGERILRYDKVNRTAAMRHIDYGLGVLRASALAPYPVDEPVDLATVYGDLLARGELTGFEVSERFHEIGSPAGLDETRAYLSARTGHA